MSANKRLSHGLLATINYTYSRRRAATSLLNVYDDQPFEDIDSNDRPHRLTITALYALPFGPGQAFGGNTSGVTARLIEGWQVNLIGEVTSGTPIGMNSGAIPVADHFALPAGQQTLDKWFDTSTKSNPRPDGYAWDVLGTNDSRGAFSARRRRDSKPSWSISFFRARSSAAARSCSSAPRCSTSPTFASMAIRTRTRRRRISHRLEQPDQLHAHGAAGIATGL
jgi:hypothetical protein